MSIIIFQSRRLMVASFILPFVTAAGPLSGATVSVPNLISTTTAFSDGDPTDAFPLDDTIDLFDLVNNKGVVGVSRSEAASLGLSVDAVNVGDFQVTGGSTSLSSVVDRNVAAGGPVTGSSTSSYTITFTLGSAETGNLSLNFGYLLDGAATRTLNWSLTGPNANVFSVLSGNLTGTGLASGTTAQSATLSTAGTYTFTISTSVPSVTLNNIRLGSSTVTNFALTYSVVPEPSSTALLGVFISTLLMSRRRRPR